MIVKYNLIQSKLICKSVNLIAVDEERLMVWKPACGSAYGNMGLKVKDVKNGNVYVDHCDVGMRLNGIEELSTILKDIVDCINENDKELLVSAELWIFGVCQRFEILVSDGKISYFFENIDLLERYTKEWIDKLFMLYEKVKQNRIVVVIVRHIKRWIGLLCEDLVKRAICILVEGLMLLVLGPNIYRFRELGYFVFVIMLMYICKILFG